MFPLAIYLPHEKDLSKSEKKYLEKGKQWQQTEGSYSMIQGTKPQTLGYGLNDSPAGLAAWIIYWATQTINSAIRIYYEAMKAVMNAKYNPLEKLNPFDKTGDKPSVPAAFAIFPHDLLNAPKDFAEQFFNILQWTEMPAGGHFAAMEQTQLLAEDIKKFVKLLQKEVTV
ncbi:MAG: hypothetical protein M3139_15565 [Bacteroidota bacterium]|nr:hypothetical protein [Bacteroidota bacterium]